MRQRLIGMRKDRRVRAERKVCPRTSGDVDTGAGGRCVMGQDQRLRERAEHLREQTE